LFLDGILRILKDENNYLIQNITDDTSQITSLTKSDAPDILLVHASLLITPYDIYFKKLRSNKSDLKIMIISPGMEKSFLLQIIRLGANGYLNANMSGEHLVKAIDYIASGKMWVEREILEQLAQDALDMENVLEGIALEKTRMISDILTKREAQVFQWVLKGLSTKEIADQIHLSEQSVKLHLGKLFKKFDVTNRPQLILTAFEQVSPVSNLLPLIQMALEKRGPGKTK
jgi:DNA-binding NarL/FixJ family response regulator